jgi:hypothetical protein
MAMHQGRVPRPVHVGLGRDNLGAMNMPMVLVVHVPV